jgi:UDP-GlcNAc:undecaprenyl-phosphate GlcNAc-1-phosphate transferase
VELLTAFGLAFALTPLAGRVGRRIGLVDHPSGDDLKIHRAPVPLLGGPAVLVATAVAAAVHGLGGSWAIGAGVAVAMGAGLVDDARPLPAWLRVLFQATAGLVLATAWGGWSSFGWLGVLGVMLLVIACTNGVNILDGQDGLSGGLGTLGAGGLAAVAAILGAPSAVGLGLALAGGLMGFLLWNRPPARVFLGDGGAYGVGTVLAALTVQVTQAGGGRGLLAAGACLGIFAFDLVFTIGRRLRYGTPVTQGDRLHSYDLVADRLGRGTSTLVFLALGSAAAVVAVTVTSVPAAVGLALVGAGAAVLIVLGWQLWTRRGSTTPDDGGELRPDSVPERRPVSYAGDANGRRTGARETGWPRAPK